MIPVKIAQVAASFTLSSQGGGRPMPWQSAALIKLMAGLCGHIFKELLEAPHFAIDLEIEPHGGSGDLPSGGGLRADPDKSTTRAKGHTRKEGLTQTVR